MSLAPQISCIIPAYNAERYLRPALESVFAQTDVSFEVIVVDDGSSDGTVEIVASYGDRIQLLRQVNSGQAAARNRGIAAARGELIIFMDADDLCSSNRFATQLAAFAAQPGLGLCAAYIQNFTGELIPAGAPVAGYNIDMMWRRSLFEQLGNFTVELQHAARLEWMLRARQAGVKECLLPDVVLYRRLHEENMSLTQSNESLREHLQVLRARIKRS